MTDWPITTEDGVPIFPPTDPRDAHLHVLLDGAADGNTVAGLYDLFPEAEGCLLLAVRHEARHLAQSGPFLARIPLDARAREWAQRDAGRNGSSIFLFSSLGFYPLCRHLESLLTCETTYGQRLFFRFFDANILHMSLRHDFRPVHRLLAACEALATRILDEHNVPKWIVADNPATATIRTDSVHVTHEDMEFFHAAALRRKVRDHLIACQADRLRPVRLPASRFFCGDVAVTELSGHAEAAVEESLLHAACERFIRLETEFGIHSFLLRARAAAMLADASQEEFARCRDAVIRNGGSDQDRLYTIYTMRNAS